MHRGSAGAAPAARPRSPGGGAAGEPTATARPAARSATPSPVAVTPSTGRRPGRGEASGPPTADAPSDATAVPMLARRGPAPGATVAPVTGLAGSAVGLPVLRTGVTSVAVHSPSVMLTALGLLEAGTPAVVPVATALVVSVRFVPSSLSITTYRRRLSAAAVAGGVRPPDAGPRPRRRALRVGSRDRPPLVPPRPCAPAVARVPGDPPRRRGPRGGGPGRATARGRRPAGVRRVAGPPRRRPTVGPRGPRGRWARGRGRGPAPERRRPARGPEGSSVASDPRPEFVWLLAAVLGAGVHALRPSFVRLHGVGDGFPRGSSVRSPSSPPPSAPPSSPPSRSRRTARPG